MSILNHGEPPSSTSSRVVSKVHSHRVVHGDLKPSNWLWDAQREVPILCDFDPRFMGQGEKTVLTIL
jgi:serine/threonine protein kinase